MRIPPLSIKNWYVLNQKPTDDLFAGVIEYYEDSAQAVKLQMPKDLTDILDVQRYSSASTIAQTKFKDLPEIKYIAGDLHHMGEFKKWTIGMPVIAYSFGVGSNVGSIANREKNKEKILYTVISNTKIPIRLENIDSHKILIKRSKEFLSTLI